MDETKLKTRLLNGRILSFTILIFSIILFLWVSFSAVKLRPVGDDYCFGSISEMNVPQTIWHWYQTWIGEITGIIFSTIFVGLPSGYLSLSLASLIPFTICLLFVGMTAWLLFRDRNEGGVGQFLSITFWFAIAWFIYLWFPTFPTEVVPGRSLVIFGTTQAISMWQIVGLGYISTGVLGVLTLYFLDKPNGNKAMASRSYLTAGTLGILTGFSSYATAASVIFIGLFIQLSPYVLKQRFPDKNTKIGMIFIITSLVSLFFSFKSPGANARKVFMPSATIENLVMNFIPSIDYGISTYINITLHTSSLVLIVSIFVLTAILKINYLNFRLSVYLILASLLVTIFFAALESITYPAYYHYSTSRLFWFFGLSTFVVSIKTRVLSKKIVNTNKLTLSIGLISILMFFGMTSLSIANFKAEVSDRYYAWESGKTYKFLPDIDQQMFSKCWEDLIKVRKSRGLPSGR